MSNRPRRVLVCLDCPICTEPENDKLWLSQLMQKHPHCTACRILMGPGHVEQEIAKYCGACVEAYHRTGAFPPETVRGMKV